MGNCGGRFHQELLQSILRTDTQRVPSNADKDSVLSVQIATGILHRLGENRSGTRLAGQIAGKQFEVICADYLRIALQYVQHLLPGTWEVTHKIGGGRLAIAQFEQYAHLAALDEAIKATPFLAAIVGSDYLIRPDIVVLRYPFHDREINHNTAEPLVNETIARRTIMRAANTTQPLLQASISCKWTLRSDRAQNARAEALNLIRNRKGHLPHIAVITGEPMPSRIASLALGTGDIDCVYHFALDELRESLTELNMTDAVKSLQTMLDGQRLRDISDLPFDLIG